MIKFEHVGLRYGIGPEVLSDINLTLERGSFHFLTGDSGAGKTSLMRLISMSVAPTRGILSVFGNKINGSSRGEITTLKRKIGMVFQDFRLLENLSVFENVALPLRIIGAPEREIKKDVSEMLDWVGLGDYQNMAPLTLSGGQAQRAAIARAVIARPQLVLADEPTGNLDDNLSLMILDLFEQLGKMGTTIVIATHSHELLERYKHPRLTLSGGYITSTDP